MVDQPRGKFIVLEGSDGAGKKTQSELLRKVLEERGVNVKLISFPQYDTPFGELVGNYLRGEYGGLDEVPPEISVMLFAIDRYQFRDEINNDLANGVCYLSDRYSQSNLGFQPAQFKGEARWEFVRWIDTIESRLPQPDLVIFLHLPIDISQRLIEDREDKDYLHGAHKDIYESDKNFQQAVLSTYLDIARNRENWVVINCVAGERLLSIEEIHERIMEVVDRRITF